MKTQHISFLAALLSVALLTVGCESASNDTAPLTTPAPTAQKGVSARINNQVWQSAAEQTTTDKAYYAVRGGINPNELTIIGFGAFSSVSNAAKTDRITIFLNSVTGIGTYLITAGNQAVYTATATGTLVHYATDATRTGTVKITKYDLTNGLVSGTFTFSAVAGSTVVSVTDGQFTDVPFGK
jgi:Family of unknown function (DUF6252)